MGAKRKVNAETSRGKTKAPKVNSRQPKTGRVRSTPPKPIAAHKRGEDRYRSLFENAVEGIFQSTPEGRFTIVNPAMAHIYGYDSPQEMIASVTDISRQIYADPERRREFASQLTSEGIVEKYEDRNLRKDGSVFWTKTNARAVKDANGKIVYYEGFVTDITERRRGEEALRASEERYRGLFEHMIEGYAYCRMIFENGRACDWVYLSVNDAFETLTGLKNAAGKRVTQLIPDIREADPELFNVYARVSLTGNPEKFEMFVESLKMWFSISVYSPEKEFFVAVFDVVTDRKRAEEALRESEERLSKIFSASPIAISVAGLSDGKLTEVNDVWCKLMGFSREEAVGFNVEELKIIDSEHRSRIREEISSKGSLNLVDSEITTKSGEKKSILTSAELIMIKGSPFSINLVIDITERKKAEETLRENEDRYRDLVEHSQDLICTHDLEGRILSVNLTAVRALGYSADEIINRNLLDFLSPGSDSAFKAYLNSIKEQGVASGLLRVRARGGEIRVWEYNNNLRQLADETPIVRGMARDVTDRWQAEKALRHAEAKYRNIFENAMEGIFQSSPSGKFLTANPALARMVGYATPEELIAGVNDINRQFYVQPGRREEFMRRLSDSGMIANFESEVLRKDGSTIWISENAQAVRDDRGQVLYYEGTLENITERKQAEEALYESRQMLRLVLDTIPVRVFWKDVDSNYLGANQTFALDAGLSSVEELIGKNDFAMGWAEQAEAYRADDRLVIDSGESRLNYEEPQTTPDGRRIWLRTNKSPLLDAGGNIKGILGTYEDITERKRAEKAERDQRNLAEALRETAETLNRTLDFGKVLDHILDTVGNVVPHDSATVILIEAGNLRLTRSKGYLERGLDVEKFVAELSLTEARNLRQIFETGQPVIVSDTRTYEGWKKAPETEWLLSNLGAPMSIYGEIIGFILLDSGTSDFFTSTHAENLQAFANQAALAIHNARLYEHAQEEIAARKQAEEALRASESELRALFSAMHDVVLVIDRDGVYRKIAPTNPSLLYKPPEELLGKSLAEVFPPGEAELFLSVAREVLATQQSKHIEYQLQIGGTTVWFSANITAMSGDLTLWVAYDITERKASERTLQRQLKEIMALHSVALAANHAAGVDDLLELTTSIVSAEFYPDHCGVLLVNEAAGLLEPHSSYRGVSREKALAVPVPLGQGIAGWVAASGQPMRVADVSSEAHYLEVSPETRSELCVPIKIEQRAIGVINAESTQADFFTEADERLLITIAGQLATSIEKLRLFESEARRRREAEALREATAVITSTLEQKQVLDSLLVQLAQVIPYDSVAVYLKENNILRIVAGKGTVPESIIGQTFSVDNVLFKEVSETHRPLILADAQTDARMEPWGDISNIRGWMGVPLIARGEVIGQLSVDSFTVAAYNETHAELAMAFANQAAAAIENARLFEETNRRATQLATLNEVGEAVSAQLDIEKVYEVIYEQLRQNLPLDALIVSLYEVETGMLTFPFTYDGDRRYEDAPVPLGETTYLRKVLQEGEPLLINKTLEQIAAEQDTPRFGDTSRISASMLFAPLQVGNQALGVISAQSYEINAYTPDHLALFVGFANQTSIAIQNARLYQGALLASERRAVLHRNSQEMVRVSQDLEQVYAAAHQAVFQLMPAEVFTITLLDEEHQEIDCAYLFDNTGRAPSLRIPVGKGFSSQVITSGESILIKDLEVTPVEAIHFGSKDRVRSLLAVPMRIGDKISGALSAQSYKPNVYGEEDRLLLEMLASQVSISIKNARLFEETRRHVAELSALAQISSALRVASTRQEMLPILVDQIMAFLGAGGTAIAMRDSNSGAVLIDQARGGWESWTGISLPEGEGISGHVILTGQPYFNNDVQNDARMTHLDLLNNLPSAACVPLIAKGATIGALWIGRASDISEEERRLLLAIADMAANAIYRASLHEQMEQQLHRISALREIDQVISASFDLSLTLETLIQHVIAQLGLDAADILLFNPHSYMLEYAAGRGFRGSGIANLHMRLGEGHAGKAALDRRLVRVENLTAADRPFSNASLGTGGDLVSYYGMPLIVKSKIKGVLEVFHRASFHPDTDWLDFLETLSGQAAIAIDNAQLYEELQRAVIDLSLAYDATIEGWSRALDLRDKETEGHTRRVTELTEQLALVMGLGEAEVVHLRRGALLHDIGKMGVPDSVLLKPGKLTDDEWIAMRKHPEFAHEMLSPIAYLRPALEIPYCHHEKWDGTGYPRGLKGDQIPLAARVFAVVDVWDALISDRPYRPAWSKEKAMEYIKEQSGTHFDSKVAEAFLQMVVE